MNKYIKINAKNEIIDVFFEKQKNKKDGTEIFLENTEIKKHKINDKSISNQYGVPIFIWNGSSAMEKTQEEIDNDVDFLVDYKKKKKGELIAKIKDSLFETSRSLDEIRVKWAEFKASASSLTTKQEIDDACSSAVTWLNI